MLHTEYLRQFACKHRVRYNLERARPKVSVKWGIALQVISTAPETLGLVDAEHALEPHAHQRLAHAPKAAAEVKSAAHLRNGMEPGRPWKRISSLRGVTIGPFLHSYPFKFRNLHMFSDMCWDHIRI